MRQFASMVVPRRQLSMFIQGAYKIYKSGPSADQVQTLRLHGPGGGNEGSIGEWGVEGDTHEPLSKVEQLNFYIKILKYKCSFIYIEQHYEICLKKN